MKVFTCDKCGLTSPHAFDEEKYPDENGKERTYDLCAPCRKDLKDKREKLQRDFFKKDK